MSRRRSKGRTEEPTDSTNSNDMLVIELKRWLTDHDIDIPYGSKKPDLVRLRNEHLATMASQAHRSQIKADSPPPAFESDSIIERACEEEEFSFLSNQEPRRSEVRDIDISSKSKDDHRSKMHEKFSRRYAYRAKPFPGIPHRHSREGVSKDMVKRRKLSWEKEPSAPDYSKIYQGIKATPEYQKDIADERIKLEKMLEQELMEFRRSQLQFDDSKVPAPEINPESKNMDCEESSLMSINIQGNSVVDDQDHDSDDEKREEEEEEVEWSWMWGWI